MRFQIEALGRATKLATRSYCFIVLPRFKIDALNAEMVEVAGKAVMAL